jgi:Na+/H+ antiporter NhaD/arsenite permease-like protein
VILPLLIFLLTYSFIAFGRISRISLDMTSAAFAGAILMVAVGGLPPSKAYAAIDLETLLLLLGMMLVVSYLSMTGFFEWVGIRIVRRTVKPLMLMAWVVLGAGLLSAFFVNDTICLLFTPILLRIIPSLGLPAAPYLIGLAAASNIGGVMSITGNPQNMLIGIHSGIRFGRFLLLLAPVAVLGLLFEIGLIAWIYRKDFYKPSPPHPSHTSRAPATEAEGPFLRRGLTVGLFMLLFFLLGYPAPLVALGGGGTLLLIGGKSPQEIFKRVDWMLLVFFGSLFVVMKGMEASGWIGLLIRGMPKIDAATPALEALGLGGLTMILSNLVSNVPAVVLLEPLARQLPRPELAWLTLAMASTLAGNLTLIGSIANLIVVSLARPKVKISFFEYLKIGLILTPITFLIGLGVLILESRFRWI